SNSLVLYRVEVDLNQKIAEVVKDMGTIIPRSKKLKIDFVSEGNEKLLVQADSSRLSEVLFNLIGNAVKFTDEGTIIVSTRQLVDGNGTAAIVSIKDNGSGIDPDIMQRLFTKFTSRSEHGTGLGL